MIFNTKQISVDAHGMENREEDDRQFRISAYNADMRKFISGRISPHWHKELELFELIKGRVEVVADDRVCMVEAGEACFINSGVLHTFRVKDDAECEYRSFVFDSSIIAGAPGSIFDTKYVKPFVENGHPFVHLKRGETGAEFFELFDRCFALFEEEGYGYELEVRDCLGRMLLCIGRCMSSLDTTDIPHLAKIRIKDMLGWIDRNLTEEITVSGIAGSANICVRECQRIFRQYVHYRPMEYVQRRRVTLAAQLLGTTDRKITDIAMECGFSSVSYFIKQFKLIVGETPIKYRKEYSNSRAENV